MVNGFSHELVSVIKRACFARHGVAIRPSLLVVGVNEQDLLLSDVLNELALDSTLSLFTVTANDEALLQRTLLTATVVLAVAKVPRQSKELIVLMQKPLLEWDVVKRDACPLFWPAHSSMDFYIMNQDSSVVSTTELRSQEGKKT